MKPQKEELSCTSKFSIFFHITTIESIELTDIKSQNFKSQVEQILLTSVVEELPLCYADFLLP